MNTIKYPELGCATLLPDIQTDPVTGGSDVGRFENITDVDAIDPWNEPENDPKNEAALITTVSPTFGSPIFNVLPFADKVPPPINFNATSALGNPISTSPTVSRSPIIISLLDPDVGVIKNSPDDETNISPVLSPTVLKNTILLSSKI